MIRNNIISNWLNKKGNKDIAKKVKLEFILNDALNKAMCQKDRIQNPNSNNISEFVTNYLKLNKRPNTSSSWECFNKEDKAFYNASINKLPEEKVKEFFIKPTKSYIDNDGSWFVQFKEKELESLLNKYKFKK
jgi:hypothetical protein